MTSEFVDLVGLKELEKALGELPKSVARRAGLAALREGGEPIARAARALAPRGFGDLVESIGVGTRLSRAQKSKAAKFADLEMHIGPGTNPQAITQEFGTYFHPAQPFMRPAWEAQRMNALDLIGAHLGVNIEKAAAREGAKALRRRVRSGR